MRFGFDEDQRLLQKTLRDFLASECPVERIRALWDTETGRSPELWKSLAELGVTGLLVPEAYEGMGMDEAVLVLLHEEAGRAALAEPLVATAVAVPLLVGLGSRELCERWLKPLAVGEAIVAVGHPVNAFVSDAHVARLCCSSPTRTRSTRSRPPTSQRVRQPVNDPARRVFSVRLVADGGDARRARRAGARAAGRRPRPRCARLRGAAARRRRSGCSSWRSPTRSSASSSASRSAPSRP